MGSSIVKHGFVAARQRPGGINLTLQRMGVSIWWQGKSGLTLSKLKNHIKVMLKLEDPPNYIVIHIGGNDIGHIRLGYLHYQLEEFMSWLAQLMPETTLIWSQILPRMKWRYSENLKAIERCRLRLNSSVGVHMVRHGGCYIRYPDIKATKDFIMEDGVHLTKVANGIFLNILQGALESIITNESGGITFPNSYN